MMKNVWNWIVTKRRTLAKLGLVYLAIEFVVALVAVLGLKTLL